MPMWTLDEAVTLARLVNAHTSIHGWYPCIGGGTLIRGWSDHDLDIIFVPKYGAKLHGLHDLLRRMGWEQKRNADAMRAGWKDPDQKHVEEWAEPYQGRRVDAIVLTTENIY